MFVLNYEIFLERAYAEGDVVSTLPSPTMSVRAIGWREGETEAGGVVVGVCGGEGGVLGGCS